MYQAFIVKVTTGFNLFTAHKIVSEMLIHSKGGNGLINVLVEENVKPEDIKRIIGDFVIAAGDTVFSNVYNVGRLTFFCFINVQLLFRLLIHLYGRYFCFQEMEMQYKNYV